MVNVEYKKPYGTYTLTQKDSQGEKKFKITLCRANCLWAEMVFFKNDKGEDMVQLYNFFSDIKHMKKCIKSGLLKDMDNFRFHAKRIEGNKSIWEAIKLLAENGKKVTISKK